MDDMQPTRIGALTMSGVAFTKSCIRTYPDRVDNATSRQVLNITTMLACQAWAPQRVNIKHGLGLRLILRTQRHRVELPNVKSESQR